MGTILTAVGRRRAEQRFTVGVDVTPLWESLTGVGWYLYRLLEHLTEVDGVAIRLYGPNQLEGEDVPDPVMPLPRGPSIEHVVFEVPHDLTLRPGFLMRCLQWLEPLLIACDGNEVLFAPNYFLPGNFTLARGKVVATIHDLGSRTVPDTLAAETLDALRRNLDRSVRRATRLISVSAAVKNELVDYGYATAGRVDVVHHGPGQLASVEPTRLPDGVDPPYALHVGTLEPRKNIRYLLDVWHRVREAGHDVRLVLCGRLGWKAEEISSALADAEAEGWCRQLGYVEEGELAALYRDASLVVFPTRYEGFGLPAVEAQQAGAPLLCSDLPVLREVAGEGAIFAPADDAGAFAAAASELLDAPEQRERLVEAGRANAARLSWQRAATETVASWRTAKEGR